MPPRPAVSLYPGEGIGLGQGVGVIGFEQGNGPVLDASGQKHGLAILPAAGVGVEVIGKFRNAVVDVVVFQLLPALIGLMMGKYRAA